MGPNCFRKCMILNLLLAVRLKCIKFKFFVIFPLTLMREQSRLRILQNAYTLAMLMATLFFIISQFFLNKSLVPSPIKRFMEVEAVTNDLSNIYETLPILILMLSP